MRFLPVLVALVALSFAGCVGDDSEPAPTVASPCTKPELFKFYLTPEYGFNLEPSVGMAAGNGFVEAFLTNDMEEFRGTMEDLLGNQTNLAVPEEPYRWVMEGNFTYQLVVESGIAVAPIVSTADPTTGYHFFNQFGTSQGFTSGYDVFYEDTVTTGEEYRYEGGWEMPPGGYPIEPQDELRFLLTNLVLPDESGQSPSINTEESWIAFTAQCEPMPTGLNPFETSVPVDLPLNQGLLTGAVPANDLNQFRLDYTLTGEEKVQFVLTAPDEVPKDDVDMTFYHDGVEFWSGGSPYTNEIATIWLANFEALGIDGDITVEVNGYSSIGYSGELVITAWK